MDARTIRISDFWSCLIISGGLLERSHDSDQRFMSIFWSFLESSGALPRFGSAIYAQFDHFWRSFGTLPRFGSAISDHFWSFLKVFWSAPTIRISDLSSVLIISGALLAVLLTRGPDAPARWPRARGPWRERERALSKRFIVAHPASPASQPAQPSQPAPNDIGRCVSESC